MLCETGNKLRAEKFWDDGVFSRYRLKLSNIIKCVATATSEFVTWTTVANKAHQNEKHLDKPMKKKTGALTKTFYCLQIDIVGWTL